MSEVQLHICRCPAVRTTRLNKLEGGRERERCYVTPPIRQAVKLAVASEKLLRTFSTRSMKKSLTSFVLVSFEAMLTRPLERF